MNTLFCLLKKKTNFNSKFELKNKISNTDQTRTNTNKINIIEKSNNTNRKN